MNPHESGRIPHRRPSKRPYTRDQSKMTQVQWFSKGMSKGIESTNTQFFHLLSTPQKIDLLLNLIVFLLLCHEEMLPGKQDFVDNCMDLRTPLKLL